MCGVMTIDSSLCFVLAPSASFEPIATDEAEIPAPQDKAPTFAAPLHDNEFLREQTSGAKSPPTFVQSFETTEEVLPFELSIEQPSGKVVIKPISTETTEEPVEEIREELVELEVKAELKWAKR